MVHGRQIASTQEYLIKRVGKAHLRQRIGVETDHEADYFGQGLNLVHIENLVGVHTFIRGVLKVTGMAGRGRRNVLDVQVRDNDVPIVGLPKAFAAYTILQLSDLHLDVLPEFPAALAEIVKGLDYDICVLTGDYRFRTHGPWAKAMEGLAVVRKQLKQPIYAILGNHDSIFMTESIEKMGIQLLLNENVVLEREGEIMYLAGIDDPHYYRADNLEKTHEGILDEHVAILLAHSPEIYKHAAFTGFDFMMCGHTHGGQICLPGGHALSFNASSPREMGVGSWEYHMMQGYTSSGTGSSVVAARFNCPPEVTLHRLRCMD